MKVKLFLTTALVLLGLTACRTPGQIQAQAESNARNYALKMQLGNASAVSCSDEDTDGNQYVSCDVNVSVPGTKKVKVYSLDCKYSGSSAMGACKKKS